MLLGEFVHAGARSEAVRVLGATVQHDDQGNSLAGVAARDVEFVGAGARAVGVRTLDEVSSSGTLMGGELPSPSYREGVARRGCAWSAQGSSTQPRQAGARPYVGPPPVPGSLTDETGDHLYRLVSVADIFLAAGANAPPRARWIAAVASSRRPCCVRRVASAIPGCI